MIAAAIQLVRRFVGNEDGQDLVEYALLIAIVGIVGLAEFPTILTKLGNAFSAWGTAVHDLWIPPDPAS